MPTEESITYAGCQLTRRAAYRRHTAESPASTRTAMIFIYAASPRFRGAARQAQVGLGAFSLPGMESSLRR